MSGGFGGLDAGARGHRRARSRPACAPIKINAVVQRGVNDHTVLDLVERFRGTGVIVRFIEYMDVGNRNALGARRRSCRRAELLRARSSARWPRHAAPGRLSRRSRRALRATTTAPARSASSRRSAQPFCGDCTRARLSSDGVLYTCLFATRGHRPARAAARRRHATTSCCELMRGAWTRRADRYSEQRGELRRRERRCARSRCTTSADE